MKLTKLGAAFCALFSVLVWTATPAFAGEPITWQGPVLLPNGQTSTGPVAVSSANPLPVNASVSNNSFKPTGTTTLDLSTTSVPVQLPSSDKTVLIRNTSTTTDAYIKFGGSSVTAATTDVLIPAGQAITFDASTNTYVAGIVASGTARLAIATGTGQPAMTGGGVGGGGSGGSITVADGADATQGTTTDSTWDGVSAATAIAIQKYIGTKIEATRAAIALPQAGCGSSTCVAIAWRNPATGAFVDPDADTNVKLNTWGIASTTVLGKVGFDTSNNTVKPSDGTNTITVKPSATSPTTADTALVMVQSPVPSPVCTSSIAISQTASTDLVTSTGKLYICSIVLVSATAQSISLVEGTGTTCATGIAALIGGTTASMALAANGGFISTAYRSWIQTKTAADHLCLLQSGSGNISGTITYKDF